MDGTLYIEAARHHRLTDAERDRIAACLRYADQLGGVALTIPGSDIVDDVIAYAQANNITHIVVGKASRSRWFEMLHGSVVHDLVRRAGHISVLVMAGEEDEETAPSAMMRSQPKERDIHLLSHVIALAAVIGATSVGFALRQFLNVGNLALVFISAITFVAARFGLAPSLFACGGLAGV
jgi:two-component system sensor histidine kinase KdpD